MEPFGFGTDLGQGHSWRYIFNFVEEDGATGFGIAEVRFEFVARDAKMSSMRLPDVSRTSRDDPIYRYADRNYCLWGFGINPHSATRLDAWRTTPQFRCLFTSNDPLNELVLHGDNDIAFTHGYPVLWSKSVAVELM
jgi:hypothetical protein